ncbi:hypothetical protein GCM10023216_23610 [Isoptericola chiayiensis]|uniref:Uncharacterized protein n=1 Tax=Isoptericola chiayiensis TaxID=579446 RepID=A0ABP8YJT5_9MICO|nr:hypothetical protein [Isoptericola chiayiensis]NOV99696.1 hypothetical protein [Isoptericola chiayiensis]
MTGALLDERVAFVRQVRRAATARATRAIAEPLVVVGLGFWVVVGLAGVVVPQIVDRAGNQMDTGVLGTGGYSARWFAFALGLIMVATIAPNHVAAGGTRRSLFRGSLLAAAVGGVFNGLAYAVAKLAERSYFDALGWTWEAPEFLVFGGRSGFTLTVVAAGLAIAAYVLVGIAVAIGYLHHGPWRGTLLLVPNAAVLALAEVATRTERFLEPLGPELTGATAVAATLVATSAVVVIAAGWLRLNLRTLPIRPSR